jgi:hypothetical protein
MPLLKTERYLVAVFKQAYKPTLLFLFNFNVGWIQQFLD